MSAGRIGQAWDSLRGLPDRTPLRVKMITAVLVLAAAALAVISVIGISVLNRDLLGQADTQLSSLYQRAVNSNGRFDSRAIGPEAWVFEALLANSSPQIVMTNLQQQGTGAGPSLSSASIAWLNAHPGQALTVPGQSGGKWRVVAYPDYPFGTPNGGTVIGTIIVGLDVSSQYATIGQLVLIDLVVSAVLLVLLTVIGIAVVRASLRPLTDIEKTAGAIAAGDLTRRVPDVDPRTEVGSLAQSLNTMLSQIEMAFDARAESEFAARRSEEQMRQFLADASHELRTPLTAIRGFAEYYRQRGGSTESPSLPPGNDAAELAGTGALVSPRHGSNAEPADRAGSGPLPRVDLDRIMHRVEQESSRMGGLVEDMLLLARLDQQRPLELGTVDMLTLAADAVHDARVVAPDRSINMTVGSGAALLVLGDEARLRQVIGNLINNAISHTPEGSPIEVRVRLGSLDEWRPAADAARRAAVNRAGQVAFAAASPNLQPFPAVVFEIADQGPGLTQAQADHVFERFYRADQARTRQAGGAGLGLAIVAALVAAHGGNVWVESPPGGGAIFRIAIPLAPEARNSGPEFDDGTDPDIMDSHRGTLNAQSWDAFGPGHSAPPASTEPGNPAAPTSPWPGYPATPTSPGPGYPASPSAFPEPGHTQPGQPESSGPEPGHTQPGQPESSDPGSAPGREAAPPLPKRRPGYSGHTRT